MKSTATTVEEYLNELPEDRRAVISAVRAAVLERLPPGYQEVVNWGMLSYEIPRERYPKTYNGQPLSYVGLASQKNHYALYLMCVYQDDELLDRLKKGFAAAGKKMDMGKSCLRFRKLEDLPLDLIGEVVASTSPERFIENYEIICHLPRRARGSTPDRAA